MGLAEKRKAEEMKEWAKGWQDEVNTLAGTKVPLEVDWDKLASGESGTNWTKEELELVFLKPLSQALKGITKDKMGKDALKGALKKIQCTNTRENAFPGSWCVFKDGLLTLEHGRVNVQDSEKLGTTLEETLTAAL